MLCRDEEWRVDITATVSTFEGQTKCPHLFSLSLDVLAVLINTRAYFTFYRCFCSLSFVSFHGSALKYIKRQLPRRYEPVKCGTPSLPK